MVQSHEGEKIVLALGTGDEELWQIGRARFGPSEAMLIQLVRTSRNWLRARQLATSLRQHPLPFSTETSALEINEDNRENVRRRLLYRSQQRGWLELDIVMVSNVLSPF